MENNIDQKVINCLSDGEKSSTQIASILNKNYYDCLKILEQMQSENKIIKTTIGSYTFWKIVKVENE